MSWHIVNASLIGKVSHTSHSNALVFATLSTSCTSLKSENKLIILVPYWMNVLKNWIQCRMLLSNSISAVVTLKRSCSNELSPAIDKDAELSWTCNSHLTVLKTKYSQIPQYIQAENDEKKFHNIVNYPTTQYLELAVPFLHKK